MACYALPSFAPSAHAAVPSVATPNSLSASSALSTIERLALHPAVPPQSPRSNFHLATTSSCDAAQTQCVAACSSQSGNAVQNCISDCHDIRSVCQ
jgi:hypothetical protein